MGEKKEENFKFLSTSYTETDLNPFDTESIFFKGLIQLCPSSYIQAGTKLNKPFCNDIFTIFPHIGSCRGNYSFLEVGMRQVFKGGNYSFLILEIVANSISC